MRTVLLTLLLAAVALAPTAAIFYHYSPRPVEPATTYAASIEFEPPAQARKLEPGAEFVVRACRVIEAHRFDLVLDGGHRVHAVLPVVPKEEATAVVVEQLNKARPPAPTVVLLRMTGNSWVVDLRFTGDDGRKLSLVEFLRSRGLLFSTGK